MLEALLERHVEFNEDILQTMVGKISILTAEKLIEKFEFGKLTSYSRTRNNIFGFKIKCVLPLGND